MTKQISKYFKSTTGIDLSGTGIEQAQKFNDEKLQFRNMSLDQMIEEGKKFKFITSFAVDKYLILFISETKYHL